MLAMFDSWNKKILPGLFRGNEIFGHRYIWTLQNTFLVKEQGFFYNSVKAKGFGII